MYCASARPAIFYKVLNTPERIDVNEKMGHWTGGRRLPAGGRHVLRGIDHGQRISRGHAEGSLPTSQAQMEVWQTW